MGTFRLLLLAGFLSAASVQSAPAQTAVGSGMNDATAPESPGAPDEDSHVAGSLILPKVSFVSPKDGETIKSRFLAKFKVEVLKTGKAKGEPKIGEGHFHVIIDGEPVPKGQFIPHDEKHLHFEKGQKEARIKLSPGPHVLTLQFGDGTHLSYGEAMSHTIHVTVK